MLAGCLPALVQVPFFMVMYRLVTTPNPLLDGTLLGVPLGTHWFGVWAHTPVFAALFAPTLAAWYGWNSVFGLALIPLGIAFALFIVMAKDSPDAPPPKSFKEYMAVLREVDAWWFMFFYSVTFGGFLGLASTLPGYFHDQYALDPVKAGYYTAACVFAGSLRHSGEIRANALVHDEAGRIVLKAQDGIHLAAGSTTSAPSAAEGIAATKPRPQVATASTTTTITSDWPVLEPIPSSSETRDYPRLPIRETLPPAPFGCSIRGSRLAVACGCSVTGWATMKPFRFRRIWTSCRKSAGTGCRRRRM